MKKRMLSIFLALTMCLPILPTTVFAEEGDDIINSTEPPVCICETACTEEERNLNCTVCGIDGAEIKDCACFEADDQSDDSDITDENENSASDGEQIIDETDSAVAAAQALIDALPTIDTVTAADYDAVQDAYDVYLELTEEQQAKISGTAVFEELFGWFNEQTATVADCTHTVPNGDGKCETCKQTIIAKIDISTGNHPTTYYTTWDEIKTWLGENDKNDRQSIITLLADTTINQNTNINCVRIIQGEHDVTCSGEGKLSMSSGATLTIEGNSSKTFNVPIEIDNGSNVTLNNIKTDQEIKFNGTDDKIGSGTKLTLRICTLNNTATFTVVGDAQVTIVGACTFAGGISMSKEGRTLAELVGNGNFALKSGENWIDLNQKEYTTNSITSVIAPLNNMEILVKQKGSIVGYRENDKKYPLNYGEAVTFTVRVDEVSGSASGTTTYQWYFDGTAITDATAATCDYYDGTTNKLPLGEHTIRCEATNNGFTRPYSVTVVVTCDHKNGDVSAIDTRTGVCSKCNQSVSHNADYSWYDARETEFTISTAEQLTAFANIVNGTNLPSDIAQSSFSGKTVKLDADIDLEMKVTESATFIPNQTPIGTYGNPFEGEFDGDNHKITNLKSNQTDYAGLFGCVSNPAVIKNLTVEGNVDCGNVAGGIVAEVDGNDNRNVEILNCTFKGTVEGGSKTGGIVGSAQYCTIKQCANYAAVSAKGEDAPVGGIVGYAFNNITIENCFNQGEIKGEGSSGENKIGGLVGNILLSVSNTRKVIQNCYSTVAVSGNGTVGALVGKIEDDAKNVTTIGDCYYISGKTAIGAGGTENFTCTPKTEEQFKNGDVAWALEKTAGLTYVWGQKLSGNDKDTYPVFSNNTVYRVMFKDKGDTKEICDAKYTNSGELGSLPIPSPATGFCGWNTAANNGGVRFDITTTISADTTLYACVKDVQTYEVTMNGYFVGETPSEPSISPAVDDVTYYYSTSNETDSTWTELNTSNPPKLDAGTYYMRAEVGETTTSAPTTTAAKQFVVSEEAASVTVDGTTTKYADFDYALTAVNQAKGANVTLMLKKNCSSDTVTITRSMTLKLNGKKLSSTNFCISGSNVVVTIENSTAMNMDADLYVYDGAKAKIAGGTFKKLYVGQNPGGKTSNGSAKLSGGTFGAVSNSNGSVLNLLADGYGYQLTYNTWHQSDSAITTSVTVKATPIKSVSVSPTDITLTYGYTTTETLTATADVEGGSYQWYKIENETKTPIDGATGSTYTVPTGLSKGTHQFTCAVTKDGFVQWGDVTSVTVKRKKSSDGGANNVVTDNTAKVEVDVKGDTATVNIGDGDIKKLIEDGTINIDMTTHEKVENVKLPADVVEKIKETENAKLKVSLPDGSVELDKTALESIESGKDITVSAKFVPATDLTEEQQKTVGDMANIGLVVDVDILAGDAKQSTFGGGKVTISIPYIPKMGENTDDLEVWFIRDDGTIEKLGGYYDAENKCFVFETGHLSRFLLVRVEEGKEEKVIFTDVPEGEYYAEAVNWAAKNGITGGVTVTTFAPNAPCTRGQIVSFLWRAAGCPEPTNNVNPFKDVSAEAYYYKAVLWAVENGITAGTDAETFSPDAPCTRAQAVTFIYRKEKAKGGLSGEVMNNLPFVDVPQWCYEAVAWCYMNKITGGTSESTFSPDDTGTRAQIVTFLYRAR